MKKINIKVILQIYFSQGLNCIYEYLNRIEYPATDSYSYTLMETRRDLKHMDLYLKKIIE
jgi:hypothetical protein